MITLFSSPGSHHTLTGQRNQDKFKYLEDNNYAVVSLADGVSSCHRAEEGAEIAANSAAEILFRKADYFFNNKKNQTAKTILSHILHNIDIHASKDNIAAEEYSSTIASVLYDKKQHKLLFYNLGDCIIIITSGDNYYVLASPYNSEDGYCCVTTTEYAQHSVLTGVVDASSVDSVILCSDGAWKTMFDRNKLKSEIKACLLKEPNLLKFQKYLEAQNCSDDFSFAFMRTGGAA